MILDNLRLSWVRVSALSDGRDAVSRWTLRRGKVGKQQLDICDFDVYTIC
jgi:hypothetical protein